MHRTTIKLSAPGLEKLQLCRELADNPAFIWVDQIRLTIEFTFEFSDKPDSLVEQTMGLFNIVALEEDPRFEGVEIEAINEYPEAK